MKPMLASDYDESKIRFPVVAQPKIDGVRGMNMLGGLTGRSLKQHANKHVTRFFSHSALIGFDGEMAAERETHPDLCRLTTSALSTIEGEPFILWWLFDYVTAATKGLPYVQRQAALAVRVAEMKADPHQHELTHHLRIVPSILCASLEQLNEVDSVWLDMGYEGSILRDPQGLHKQGRSTIREGGLLRIKRFADFEVRVTKIIEGETNTNEAQQNELGLQFRSSHQENMVPNGMVGAMLGVVLKDVKDSAGNVLFSKGTEIRFGAGRMTHEDRLRFFQLPHLLVGQVAKVKTFLKGVKDKPRFPTFQCLRAASDIGEES